MWVTFLRYPQMSLSTIAGNIGQGGVFILKFKGILRKAADYRGELWGGGGDIENMDSASAGAKCGKPEVYHNRLDKPMAYPQRFG